MEDFRNHWIHLHHNRLTLHTPIHFSPFDALDEDVRTIVYSGAISLESIIKSWKEWWQDHRHTPFHIEYTDFPSNTDKEAKSC